jgi:predicted permease
VQERPLAGVRIVSPGYFAAMGLRLHDGRFFAEADRFGAENVCLLNETLARKLFPGESALGKAILTGPAADTVVRIVGVVRDVKANGLGAPVPDEIYFPRDQRGGAFMVLVGQARTGLAASAVIPILRHLLTDLDPNLALANPQTVPDLLKDSLGVQRVTLALLLVFAGLAALLAAVGIYSVMAYTITQRTSEIGVRMALGAGTREILALVLRLGAVQLGAGLGLGLAGALAGTRLLRRALFEVQPLDPLVFAVVPLVFAAVGVAACLIPARRAARVDPVIALRAE